MCLLPSVQMKERPAALWAQLRSARSTSVQPSAHPHRSNPPSAISNVVDDQHELRGHLESLTFHASPAPVYRPVCV